MATIPVSSPTTGRNPLAQNAGTPVLGNTGIKSPNNPAAPPVTPFSNIPGSGGIAKPNPQTAPLQSAAVTAQQTAQATSGGSTAVPGATTPAAATSTPGSAQNNQPASTAPANPITSGYTPQQQQQLQKQLIDIYGKGEGGILFGLINGLGAQNGAYMQAYEKAMAPVNAENLATLNTTLGNSGVGANSSTAAIADADFESNVTAQEGLQEQQLQQQDAQDVIGITESMEGAAQKEVASSWYNDLADVLEGVVNVIPGLGHQQVGAGSQAAAAQQAITAGNSQIADMPTSSIDQSSVPDVSDSASASAAPGLDDLTSSSADMFFF